MTLFSKLAMAATCTILLLSGYASAESRVNIIFEPGVSSAEQDRALARVGGSSAARLPNSNGVTAFIPGLSAQKALAKDSSVASVEIDFKMSAITPGVSTRSRVVIDNPNEIEVYPTGIRRADAVPESGAVGFGAKVAIIDTGIDQQHPDLSVNSGIHYFQAPGGKPWERAREDANFDDDHFHGTHVAGTVAALDNLIGVVGIVPGAELLAVKVLDSTGSGYISDIARGIDWAVTNGADVINMSLGGPSGSQVLQDAVEAAALANVLIACAAGNEGPDPDTVGFPAQYPECIAIAAWADMNGVGGASNGEISSSGSEVDEALATFSSRGSQVDITAPGVDILSTWPEDAAALANSSGVVVIPTGTSYATISGTSMASPHVAGVLALMVSKGIGDPRSVLCVLAEGPLHNSETNTDYTASEVGCGLLRLGTLDTVAPAAPTGLVIGTGADFVELSWDDNLEADFSAYRVYRNGNQVATVTTSSYMDTGLTASTPFAYYVTAVDVFDNESGASNEVNVSTLADTTAPAQPTNLTASATSDSKIQLDWADNTESDLAGYNVYRSTTDGFTPGVSNLIASGVNVSSYSDSGLTALTTYYYRVTAMDVNGNESAASGQTSATTLQRKKRR